MMQLNGKKFCIVHKYHIMVEENIVHWHGYLNKKDSKKIVNRYWDNDAHQTILYRNNDELLSVIRHKRNWGRVNNPRKLRSDIDNKERSEIEYPRLFHLDFLPDSLMDHSIDRGAVLKTQSRKTKWDKEYVERLRNDSKIKNTMVHYQAVRKSKHNKSITIDDVPDCHLLMMYPQDGQGDNTTTFYSQDWNRYRNIVPYKSNLVDSARNFLDLFVDHYKSEGRWDNSVFDTDKKILWKYLDDNVFTKFETVPRELKKHGIEFEYFNMDKDSYKKTFEIDKDPFFRLMTYNTINALKNFPTKEVRDRYHRLTDIAKEYVAQCGREDNRITL